MWIDDRGSEVLSLGECRRLLAVGAKAGLHGHLGIAKDGAPLVLPVDYTTDGSGVVVRIGDHIFEQIDGSLVAFQVDNAGSNDPPGPEGRWSILVRGLVGGRLEPAAAGALPHPRVAEPGEHLVYIRGDVMDRRLRPPVDPGAA